MKFIKNLFSRWAAKPAPEPVAVKVEQEAPRKINPYVLAMSGQKPDADVKPHEAYKPPAGVIPADAEKNVLAMDSTPYDYLNSTYCATGFKGYPYLATLTQYPEYRKLYETIAEEMTRTWSTLQAIGDTDKSEKIHAIEQALIKHRVRDIFRMADELDGAFGRGQIYIDVRMPNSKMPAQLDAAELETVLLRDPAKITKGSLIGFKVVEPVWTYPSAYNADNPLADDYYKPTSWYVMGKRVHSSRMLLFVSRPVPDMLKASYNFGGISLSQLAEQYVNNFLRTRQSVSDMVHAYSLSGIATNMQDVLSGGGGEAMFARAQLYNNIRDNRGLLLVDKESEEFFQFNTPLNGLDALQAQSQEQLASVSSIPLVKLLGISPAGLNASSEGEIEVFDDHILARKRKTYAEPLTDVINIIQLDLFGEIDPDITFEFESMQEMSDLDKATIRKTNADTDSVLIASAVISQDDARERLINDKDSGYTSLEANPEVDDVPDDDDLDGDD